MRIVERLSSNDWVPPWIRHQHLARYHWASGFVKGCLVLDAACGSGYGTSMLSRSGARHVDGTQGEDRRNRQHSDHHEHHLGGSSRGAHVLASESFAWILVHCCTAGSPARAASRRQTTPAPRPATVRSLGRFSVFSPKGQDRTKQAVLASSTGVRKRSGSWRRGSSSIGAWRSVRPRGGSSIRA